jgi:integrase
MLATQRKVSASTHNQALSAALFLYREVLNVQMPWLENINRPNQKRRIPSVLTRDEVAGLPAHIESQPVLLARLMEGMRLRIKDVDFDRHVIIGRDGTHLTPLRRNALAPNRNRHPHRARVAGPQ